MHEPIEKDTCAEGDVEADCELHTTLCTKGGLHVNTHEHVHTHHIMNAAC